MASSKLHPAVGAHLDDIIRLCKEYGVARLEVFGSAVTSEFDPVRSDVDFLIEYGDDFDRGPWGSRTDELKTRFSEIVGREVDLVQIRNIENPYVLYSVEQTRTLLYAA